MRIAIAGAGPAGSSLAIRLGRAGLQVDVFDRATFPRSKPCGEGLMPKAVEDLADLGVLGALREASGTFQGIAWVTPDARAEARFPELEGHVGVGLGVPRERLDLVLLERAAATPGVTVHQGVGVTRAVRRDGRVAAVETDAGELACDALVAADGRRSGLRRAAGLDRPPRTRPRAALVAAFDVEGPAQEVVEVHILPAGEAYLTPTGPGRLQVALCEEADALRDAGADPEGALRRRLAQGPGTAHLLEAPLASEVRVVAQLGARASTVAAGGLFLAGDAAGFLDPVTGEGTSLAFSDTRALAPALVAAAEGLPWSQVERMYAQAMAGPRTQVAVLTHLVLALSRFRGLSGFALRRLARRPALLARLVAVAAGMGSFQDVRLGEALSLLLP